MTHPSRRGGVRRSVALFLLALFLGGGTTLPSADALVYHWGKAAEPHQWHIEPAGGCTSHTETCTLGRTATGAGAVLAASPVVRLESSAVDTAIQPRRSPPLAAGRGTLPRSRAPPVTPA